MSQVVVTGYASMDYSMDIADFEGPGHTSLVTRRPRYAEPGGIARFFAGLVGHAGRAISWVGRDEESAQWVNALESWGANTRGIHALEGRMPTSFLFHASGGGSMCFFDSGIADAAEMRMSVEDEEAVSSASVAVVAVGPSHVSRRVLEIVRPDARVVWVVKADPKAFPLELRQHLTDRADVIVHSHQEDAFVAETVGEAGPALVIRTAGSGPVSWRQGDQSGVLDVTPLDRHVDATGAGDSFVGHFAGAQLDGDDVETAIRTAIEATRGFLVNRD